MAVGTVKNTNAKVGGNKVVCMSAPVSVRTIPQVMVAIEIGVAPMHPHSTDSSSEMADLIKAVLTQMEATKATIVSRETAVQQNIVMKPAVIDQLTPPQYLS